MVVVRCEGGEEGRIQTTHFPSNGKETGIRGWGEAGELKGGGAYREAGTS